MADKWLISLTWKEHLQTIRRKNVQSPNMHITQRAKDINRQKNHCKWPRNMIFKCTLSLIITKQMQNLTRIFYCLYPSCNKEITKFFKLLLPFSLVDRIKLFLQSTFSFTKHNTDQKLYTEAIENKIHILIETEYPHLKLSPKDLFRVISVQLFQSLKKSHWRQPYWSGG